MFVDRLGDRVRIVTWVDTYRAPCLFTADDTRVLLKGSYGNLFYDHLRLCFVLRALYLDVYIRLARHPRK